MEEQLIAMEASMGVQASADASTPPARGKDLDSVEQDDAGNVTFRYGACRCLQPHRPFSCTQVWAGRRGRWGRSLASVDGIFVR